MAYHSSNCLFQSNFFAKAIELGSYFLWGTRMEHQQVILQIRELLFEH